MKKYIYIFKIQFVCVAFYSLITSCTKELQPTDYMNFTPIGFFKSESDINSAVVALYQPLTIDWGTNDPATGTWYCAPFNADPKSYVSMNELTTDELRLSTGGSGPYSLYNTFSWGPSTWSYQNSAATYVKISYVARCTDVINSINKSSALNSIKKRYINETKVLRAWYMFMLLDLYGPLNPRLDPTKLTETTPSPRMTYGAYCDSIISDLTNAINTREGILAHTNDDGNSWGRVSKGLAKMLLLKLYLHNKDWPMVEATAKSISDESYYKLLDNYKDIFASSMNKEIIYAVPSGGKPIFWYITEVLPVDFATGKIDTTTFTLTKPGWDEYNMPWSFYDKFSSNDKRLSVILNTYVGANNITFGRSSMSGAISLKYSGATGNPQAGYAMDWIVFRYADVLLSRAEAINEQVGPDAAYPYVDSVRSRAGLAGWSGLTKDQFRDSILDERGRELFSEGCRRQDLIRHGKFIQYALDRGISAEAKDTLFPIPNDVVIQGNGIITQNPGY